MESPFYNLGKARTKKPAELPFEGCFCGCGLVLADQEHFKDHSRQAHGLRFVQNSSHYLSKFSEIVLPVRCWDVSMMGTDLQNELCPDYHQHQPSGFIRIKQSYLPSSPLENNKVGPRGWKPIQQRRSRREISQFKDRKTEASRETQISEEKIVWNGFCLVPNQPNPLSHFMCGSCRVSFEDAENFILHCLEDCRQLEHPESTHFIQLSEKDPNEDKQSERVASRERPSKGKESTKVLSNSKHKQGKNKGRSRLRRQFMTGLCRTDIIRNEMKGIYHFFRNYQKNEHFQCGCGVTITIGCLVYRHVKYTHQEIVPPGSSHVFIQRDLKSNVFCMLSTSEARMRSAQSTEDDLTWGCPCRPEVGMSRQKFITHVTFVHKGISPIFKAAHFKFYQN